MRHRAMSSRFLLHPIVGFPESRRPSWAVFVMISTKQVVSGSVLVIMRLGEGRHTCRTSSLERRGRIGHLLLGCLRFSNAPR